VAERRVEKCGIVWDIFNISDVWSMEMDKNKPNGVVLKRVWEYLCDHGNLPYRIFKKIMDEESQNEAKIKYAESGEGWKIELPSSVREVPHR